MLWLVIFLYVTATWAMWDTYMADHEPDWLSFIVIVLWPLAFPLSVAVELTMLMGDALRRRIG